MASINHVRHTHTRARARILYTLVWLGFSRTKIYEGERPCRLQALSWLMRPIRERQAWPQRLQLKVFCLGFGAAISRIFLLLRFPSRLLCGLTRRRKHMQPGGLCFFQVWRLATMLVHWLWPILQELRFFFRQSLHLLLGPPALRWPEDSSPNRVCFGMRWFCMLATWPAQRNCTLNSTASMLTVSACLSTTTLVT